MRFPDTAEADGRPAALPRRADTRSELDELRSICRSQALRIDALASTVSTLRGGATALKAQGAELRAERERPRSGRRDRAGTTDRFLDAGRALAVRLRCDAHAPGAARIVVAQILRDRVAAGVLDSARLLVSELVTNSVRHSGAGPEDAVIVRVVLTGAMIRLEVEDRGRGGVIAPRPADSDSGGGFGLQLVQTLSERWGLERVAAGGTLVWVQLPRTTPERAGDQSTSPPTLAPATGAHPDQRTARQSPSYATRRAT